MNLPDADREWLAKAGIADVDLASNDLGIPDRGSNGHVVGPMSPGFWRRQIDPFDEGVLSTDELNAAALRCRSAYASFLGARGGKANKGRRRTSKASEATAA